jgi:sigma-B regulation protein RsbU (phosphoserine phosphatase)
MRILRKIRQSIAVQLVIFLFLFSVTIFLLMFLVNTHMSRKIMMINAEQKAEAIAWQSINKIEGILSNLERMTTSTAYLISTHSLSEQELEGYLTDQSNKMGSVMAVTVAYNTEYLLKNQSLKSKHYCMKEGFCKTVIIDEHSSSYKYDDWFIIPTEKENGYWSEPWINTPLHTEPITSYSYPMFDKGEVIGVVRTDVSLNLLQNIVSSIRLLKSGYATLITSNGTYVTHPADSLILNYTIFSLAKHFQVPGLREAGQKIINGESGFVQIKFPVQKYPRWFYYAPISLNKWAVAIVFREDEIMQDLNKVIYVFSFILSIGLFVLLVTFFIRITTIFKPLDLLIRAVRKMGSGDFSVQLPEVKMENEVAVLSGSFSRMQAELKNYMENLVATTREKDKISAEVKFAAQIQQNIIPSDKNMLTEVKEVSIFGVLEPAEIIGGDLYDAFMIDDRRLCLVMADVFGKGIVASMLMTMVQTLIRAQSKYSTSAESLVRAINTYLCENSKQANFVTMLVCVLDLQTGIVDYCNAGHTPIYLRKADRQCVRISETHCTALGIFHDLQIDSSTLQLDAQDFMILFTDGITEAMSDNEAFFGYQRLEEIICSMQNPTPEGIVKAILQDVRSFTQKENQNDDLSILVLKFNHPKLS